MQTAMCTSWMPCAELRVLKLALHSPLGLFEAHASLQVLKPALHLALIE